MKALISLLQAFRRFPADDHLSHLYNQLAHLRASETSSNGKRHVVIECVQDPFYLALFAHLANALQKRASLQLDLLVSQSFNSAVGFSIVTELFRSFPLNWLLVNQWVRVWAVVSQSIAYRSSSLDFSLGAISDALQTWRTWRQIQCPEDLESLSISGVVCGDLIIDSYLRFRPSPRMQIGDPFLLRVLWQAHRDVRRAQRYFRDIKPIVYITTYTTYVQHGVPARVALQEGVRLVSFGNFQEFGKVHEKDDVYHTRNTLLYKKKFSDLLETKELLDIACTQLEFRLEGGVDNTMPYMRVPTHVSAKNDIPNVRGAVVIFLHDFYDSPHVYADFIFSDFWEWICFTLQILNKEGIPCFVKPHPNQIGLSDAVIIELLEQFPAMVLIPSDVTNRQLVDGGMKCAVTAYGTVGVEMAYLGVPTIACARHPFISFDFCRTAKNRTSYAALLCEALTTVSCPQMLHEESLQFFVMHHLNDNSARLKLRDAFISAWKACHSPSLSAEEVITYFEEMAKLPGFAAFADQVLNY